MPEALQNIPWLASAGLEAGCRPAVLFPPAVLKDGAAGPQPCGPKAGLEAVGFEGTFEPAFGPQNTGLRAEVSGRPARLSPASRSPVP